MHIQQLYTNCLAEAAYYIESEGEAAVIDPIRETEPYTQLSAERQAKIKYIFETHFHADFVSGHIDLAKKTGAQIIYGPMAEPKYKVHNAKDGEEFKIGKLTIRALHTPGHTMESTCYLLFDETGKQHAVFTGDTLFVGDVGRPDLLDGSGITKEYLAGLMYDSLNTKIKTLNDDVIVYPAHGAGSACGKNIGKESWSTIGEQKKTNYAMQNQAREEFIKTLTTGITPPPAYFFADASINKNGYTSIDNVIEQNVKPLSVEEFKNEMTNGALILDTRDPDVFEKGFISNSLNIGINGSYAIWAGTLIEINQPLVIVAPEGKEKESIVRLARVGFENVKGFLQGGISSWIDAGNNVETLPSVEPEKFAEMIKENGKKILDVRREGEFGSSHVKNSAHIALADLNNRFNELDPGKEYLVYCRTGYRSMIAASLLRRKGIRNVINIKKGIVGIAKTSVPVEENAGIIN
ncbi:MAG TPA: rhodanese-like domain-containing protein [Bacteroidia bacterium]|nr:rhodanese-like domain-containing protein [Bacteroidia bacterium]